VASEGFESANNSMMSNQYHSNTKMVIQSNDSPKSMHGTHTVMVFVLLVSFCGLVDPAVTTQASSLVRSSIRIAPSIVLTLRGGNAMNDGDMANADNVHEDMPVPQLMVDETYEEPPEEKKRMEGLSRARSLWIAAEEGDLEVVRMPHTYVAMHV
jgi:hypothetical protein